MEAKTQAKAVLRYARISPRKVNIVNDLIRNKNITAARGILMNTPKAASELLIKLLDSAVANAENNFGMDTDKLYVAEA
jgi:large subunit ribosomal protein L22